MNNYQRGVTLVELVIAIVVGGIAIVAVVGGLAALTSRSADPMLHAQGLAAAQSYMAEILNKPFLDPDTGLLCDATVPAASDRPNYDNICDYQGIASDNVIRDQLYSTIDELAAYSIAVVITTNAGTELNGITAADAIRIDITVTLPDNTDLNLTSYRSRY